MTGAVKGWTRQAFEGLLKLPPERCLLDGHGHYSDPQTHRLWVAFKAGVAYAPRRGTFVVAEIHDDLPLFNPTPTVYPFKDLAKEGMRTLALRTNTTCAVFQQVSAYNPANNPMG